MWGRVHLNLCNFELYLMYPQGYYSFPLHKSVVPTVIEFRSPSGLLVSAPCIRHVDPSSLSAICFSGLSGQKQRYCYTRMYVCSLLSYPGINITLQHVRLLLYASYVQSNFYQPTYFIWWNFARNCPRKKVKRRVNLWRWRRENDGPWWTTFVKCCTHTVSTPSQKEMSGKSRDNIFFYFFAPINLQQLIGQNGSCFYFLSRWLRKRKDNFWKTNEFFQTKFMRVIQKSECPNV